LDRATSFKFLQHLGDGRISASTVDQPNQDIFLFSPSGIHRWNWLKLHRCLHQLRLLQHEGQGSLIPCYVDPIVEKRFDMV